jgi:hypothetical protein
MPAEINYKGYGAFRVYDYKDSWRPECWRVFLSTQQHVPCDMGATHLFGSSEVREFLAPMHRYHGETSSCPPSRSAYRLFGIVLGMRKPMLQDM